MKNISDKEYDPLLILTKRILKIMKLSLVILFVCISGLFATETFSQAARVSIEITSASVKDVLSDIEKQTDYLFVYDKSEINLERNVSVRMRNKTVTEVLNAILQNSDIVYAMEGNNIMLMGKENLQPNSLGTQQSGNRVSGKVIDETGEPIIGANVIVKGTINGNITDLDGMFILDNVANNQILLVSYIGYLSQEIRYTGQTTLTIRLAEDSQALDEVVVVGYGTQKKANLTGAVSQISSKVFETRPVSSMATALQGALGGVNINPPTGNPNEDVKFNVRGTTSINGGDPLVLVDGVESNLKLINPSDIESISVLKDAAAASIYGVRAAFGVILITTKKGESDRLNINYSGNFSMSKATVMPEFVGDSYTHATFVNDALIRENISPMYGPDQLEAIRAYAENRNNPSYYVKDGTYFGVGHTDWVDMMVRDLNPKQRHNVSISGGTGKTRFYSSFGYAREEGVLKTKPDVFERANARLFVENQTYNWMKLGLRMLYNTSKMNQRNKYKDDPWQQIVFSSPVRGGQWLGDPAYPQYDPYVGFYFEDQNPEVYQRFGGRDMLKEHEVVLTPSVDLYLAKGWNVHVDFSYSSSGGDNSLHRKKISNMITNSFAPTLGSTNDDSYELKTTRKTYYSFNAYTDYEYTIAGKHHLKGMLGYNQELTAYKEHTAKRVNLLSESTPSLSLGTGNQTVAETGYEWALRGAFSRINYDYDSRYLLEVNARRDGTSRFPKDNRFVNLISFSAGWRVSEEKFMEPLKPLFDNIKLRGSYGSLGNQLLTASSWTGNTKYYPYIPFLSNGIGNYYLFNSVQDVMTNPSALISASLTWEKATTVNGGIDFTLLSSRLDLTFDIYRRTTSDMLISQTYPELLGAAAPVLNDGELRTDGWELSINWRDKIGKDFTYGLGLNLFDAQAKISKYGGAKSTVDGYYVGKKIGEIWGYETEGLFQTQEEVDAHAKYTWGTRWTPGDVKLKDRNEDGKISPGSNTVDDPGDKKVIGNTTPRYTYGIRANAEYKNFFLNLFFQGIGKRDFFPDNQAYRPVGTQYYNTQKWFVKDSWTEDNRGAYLPIARARSDKNWQKQSRLLQDASYIRLKNLTFGYNLPTSLIQKVKISRAQVYFSGENLWEHSSIKGPYDPEMAEKNGAMVYPFQRTYSIGIDLTF